MSTRTGNRWTHTVDVSVPWRDESLPLAEKTARIVAAFRRRFPEGCDVNDSAFAGADLDDLLADLTDAAATDDPEAFDEVWSAIYDWADDNGVWINTFGRRA